MVAIVIWLWWLVISIICIGYNAPVHCSNWPFVVTEDTVALKYISCITERYWAVIRGLIEWFPPLLSVQARWSRTKSRSRDTGYPCCFDVETLLSQAWTESPASVERYVWFTDKGYSKRTPSDVWLAPKAMIVDLPTVCWLADWLMPCWLNRSELEYLRFWLHWNSDDLIERVLSPRTEYARESFPPVWFLARLRMALNWGLGAST